MKFLLGFKRQFEPAIVANEKLRTIRKERKDGKRPQPGDTLRLYVGLRTTGCRLIGDRPCVRCVDVGIDLSREFVDGIVIDGHRLTPDERLDLARADGFANVEKMRAFFRKAHKTDSFVGWMCEWEPKAAISRPA